MRRKPVVAATLVALASFAGVVGYTLHRSAEADALVVEAEGRLAATLVEAPELDRIQASTAASLLDRARALGRDDRELSGLRHQAEALVHLSRGDLVFAESERAAARHELGDTAALHVIAAEIARRSTDLERARIHVEDALSLEPRNRRALLLCADLALDRGDASAALRALETLEEIEPEAGVVDNRRGITLTELGRLDEAEAALREAIDRGYASPDPYINLGRLLRIGRRHADAEAAFEGALGLSAADPDALLGRGLARAAQGEVEEAEADFRRAAELATNDAEPLLALGDLLRDLGSVDDAIAVYREAIAREDADAASWLKLGNALVLAHDPGHAAAAFREAIARAPELAAAHNGLGAALVRTGDVEEAEVALRRAATLDALDPNPFMNLALLHERRGDRAGAREAYERALERDPSLELAERRLAAL